MFNIVGEIENSNKCIIFFKDMNCDELLKIYLPDPEWITRTND